MTQIKYNIQYHISFGKTRLPQVQVENQMHMETTVSSRQRLGRRLLTRKCGTKRVDTYQIQQQ